MKALPTPGRDELSGRLGRGRRQAGSGWLCALSLRQTDTLSRRRSVARFWVPSWCVKVSSAILAEARSRLESDAGKVVTAEYWSPISLAEKKRERAGSQEPGNVQSGIRVPVARPCLMPPWQAPLCNSSISLIQWIPLLGSFLDQGCFGDRLGQGEGYTQTCNGAL